MSNNQTNNNNNNISYRNSKLNKYSQVSNSINFYKNNESVKPEDIKELHDQLKRRSSLDINKTSINKFVNEENEENNIDNMVVNLEDNNSNIRKSMTSMNRELKKQEIPNPFKPVNDINKYAYIHNNSNLNEIDTYNNKIKFVQEYDDESIINNNNDKKNSLGDNLLKNENKNIIYFFINQYSGNQKGKFLLNLEFKTIKMNDDTIINFYDYNDENGVINLKKDLQLKHINLIKVIICSGDGSIFPFINKINKLSIDLNKLIFCVLPYGRTNDISRQFGFTNIIDENFSKFKYLINDIEKNSTITNIDIWEIKLTLDKKNGGILNSKKNYEYDEKHQKISIFRNGFIGYFSLGYDGRIGYDVNNNRTNYTCLYKCLFFWECFKKWFFRKSIKINGFIDSMYTINLLKDEDYSSNITEKEEEGRKIFIFKTNLNGEKINTNQNNTESYQINNDSNNLDNSNSNNSHSINNEDEINESDYYELDNSLKTFQNKNIMLKGDPIGLVCQNIKYFFDGKQSNWNENENYGIEIYDSEIDKNNKEAYEVKFYFT
jgi:diacylglycerol kinase family enzyme